MLHRITPPDREVEKSRIQNTGTLGTLGTQREHAGHSAAVFAFVDVWFAALCRVFGASFMRLRGEAEGIRMLLRLRSSDRDGGRSLRLVVLKKRSHLRLGRMVTVWIGRASADWLRPGYR